MEVIKMKNRIKYLALFSIMFIFSACSGLFEFKPYFTTFVYDHRIYGIIENGKINRMGISREKVNKMNHIISNKYGIKFSSKNRIYANEDSRTYYNIKFYNDLKFILINEDRPSFPTEEEVKLYVIGRYGYFCINAMVALARERIKTREELDKAMKFFKRFINEDL